LELAFLGSSWMFFFYYENPNVLNTLNKHIHYWISLGQRHHCGRCGKQNTASRKCLAFLNGIISSIGDQKNLMKMTSS